MIQSERQEGRLLLPLPRDCSSYSSLGELDGERVGQRDG